MRTPLLLLLTWLLCGCGSKATPAAPGAAADGTPAPVRQGTLHLLTLNRLQGFGEAIPCNPQDIAVLPAAAELRDRLATGPDAVRLVALGDAINRSFKPVHGKAAELSALARSRVALEALAAAHADIYVPGHGDFATGFDALLDRCQELGLPVLVSNLAVPSHPNVQPWLLIEAGTLKIGCLAVIAAKVGEAEDPTEAPGAEADPVSMNYPGASLLPVGETVGRLAKELHEQHGADLVVVFSNVSQKTNTRLVGLPGVDVIVGCTDNSVQANGIIIDGSTALMSSRSAGREVGHTTLAIRDGDMEMADMSPLHELPGQIAHVEQRLQEYADRFGTSEPATLARLVAPGDEASFLNMVQLLGENREFLEVHRSWSKSYIDHRAAELLPPRPDHPVLAILAGQGPAIEAALAASELKPAAPPEGRPIIPRPEDCQACHAAQYAFWEATPHARAYAPLQALHRNRDVSCLDCHTAGYEDPNGWADPRFDAPLGAVTCFQCHQVYALHSSSARQVVDPQYVHSDVASMTCVECHAERRSPGFDKSASLALVSCPPLRDDEPALLLARQGALDVIRNRRAKGIAEPRDDYLEGRALVGLGAFEEGYDILNRFALDNPADPDLRVEIARLFEKTGNSQGALELLESYLHDHTGDPTVNKEYVTLLLNARDEAVRDPEHALAQLSFLMPKDAAESHKAALDFRVLQIDALFATGHEREGLALINELVRDHAQDPRLKERIARYLPEPPPAR